MAHKQEPDRDENGVEHDGYKKSPHGNESKHACAQTQISRGPLEDFLFLNITKPMMKIRIERSTMA
jgi:hypothetical protein